MGDDYFVPRGVNNVGKKFSLNIIHVDMDAFYASVEQRDNPKLRDKPVVVGGSPQGRGVVSTCSYEARKFGIHSAMPAAKAKALCPSAIFVPPDFAKYRSASDKVRGILRDVGDKLELVGLDEAFVQLPDGKNYVQTSRHIKRQIQKECKLDCSVGLSYNKPLAKLASEWEKPDGFVVIRPENSRDLLSEVPLRDLWGIGPKTEEILHRRGIITCSDFRSTPKQVLIDLLGVSRCWDIALLCNGLHIDEISGESRSKSVSREQTFVHDTEDPEDLEMHLRSLASDLTSRLKRSRVKGRTVTLKIKFSDFSTITRSHTAQDAVGEQEQLTHIGLDLMAKALKNSRGRGIRLLGLGLSSLLHKDSPRQLSFF